MNAKDLLNKGKIHPRKRCPFCGAAGEKKTKKDASGTVMHYVECVNCGARTKYHKYLADAIAQWDHQIHDTKQKKGHWNYKEENEIYSIACSECGQQYCFQKKEDVGFSKFCPECGARLIQRECITERKISLRDQIEVAARINQEKVEKDHTKNVTVYRNREMAEDFLKKIIGIEEDDDIDM